MQPNDSEQLDRLRNVLDIWTHNRKLYPGWLVFPSGQERSDLSHRTGDWEPPILNAFPHFTPADQLKAIRELMWRKEILLEPITPDLEAAAKQALHEIDCEKHTIGGFHSTRDDWAEVREAWIAVALVLVTDARLDWNLTLFKQRLDALKPFVKDGPDIEHRIQHERCLWAVYSLEFGHLNELLDGWIVENCDPAWMLRKAALLTEARRYEDSVSLVERTLNSLRQASAEGKSIASASREGWALASTLTMNNHQSIIREWSKLASLKCDAGSETDHVRRAMMRTDKQDEAPSFDVGLRRGTRVRYSNLSRSRLIAAYRAVRLLEVGGVPPVNNPGRDADLPMSMVSDLLTLAADELVTTNPKLAIRLVLRVCTYDKDKMLQRVLSRTHLARLPGETVAEIAQLCMGVIKYALPRLFTSDEPRSGISWVERMRVALEVLSRLVLRLPPDMVNDTVDIGLECYRTDRVAQHYWLGRPLGNMLQRAWEALSKARRRGRVFDLLAAPIVGLDNFAADTNCPDPGDFIDADDLPPERTTINENHYQEVVGFLVRGLIGNDDARNRATLRLMPLVISHSLTDKDSSDIANALWSNSDPILQNSTGPNSPFDWVYLILPEMEEGEAERSFRLKWLTSNPESQAKGLDYSSNMLAQVGAAVIGLRGRGRPFVLSIEEEQHIATHIEKLIEMFSSSSISFNVGIWSTIRHVGSLAAEITMAEHIAQNLYRRLEFMLGTQSQSKDSLLGPVKDIRLALGFAVIPGLVRAMPNRFDDISLWLRTGLASEDDARVSGTMAALRSWLSASSASTLRPVPDDLIREVGVIIASDRRVALLEALDCATLVFDRGTQSHRDTIGPLVLQGLSYLAEKLEYDAQEDIGGDVHTLRLLCAQLATKIAPHGFENDAAVAKWLDIGRSDPFPETRNVVMSYESE